MGIGDQLKKIKDLKKIQEQAKSIQKRLEEIETEVDERGVRVVMTGDLRIKELSVSGISNQILIDVLNKAIRKAQELSAQKLREMSGAFSAILNELKS